MSIVLGLILIFLFILLTGFAGLLFVRLAVNIFDAWEARND